MADDSLNTQHLTGKSDDVTDWQPGRTQTGGNVGWPEVFRLGPFQRCGGAGKTGITVRCLTSRHELGAHSP